MHKLFEDFLDNITDDDSKGRSAQDIATDVSSDDSIEKLKDEFDTVLLYRFWVNMDKLNSVSPAAIELKNNIMHILDVSRCILEYKMGKSYILGINDSLEKMIPAEGSNVNGAETIYYIIPIGVRINFSVKSIMRTFARLYDATESNRKLFNQNLLILINGV